MVPVRQLLTPFDWVLGWNGLNFLLDGERRARFIVWMTCDALLALSKEDLVALVLARPAQIEALTAQVAALQARLNVPPKTLDNASTPPSRGAKPNRPASAVAAILALPAPWPNTRITSSRQLSMPVRLARIRSGRLTRRPSTPMTTSNCRRSARSSRVSTAITAAAPAAASG